MPNVVDSSAGDSKATKNSIPSPQELISLYQSQGLDSEEASLKVIEDLQNALYRIVSTRSRKDKATANEAAKKLDLLSNKVSMVSAKIDTKPGYLQTFTIGVASGFAFRGFEMVWPHVVGGISQIWSTVSSATNPSNSPSS